MRKPGKLKTARPTCSTLLLWLTSAVGELCNPSLRGFSANDSLLSVNHTHPDLNEKGRFCRKGTRTQGKTMSKSASTYCVKPSETTVPLMGTLDTASGDDLRGWDLLSAQEAA